MSEEPSYEYKKLIIDLKTYYYDFPEIDFDIISKEELDQAIVNFTKVLTELTENNLENEEDDDYDSQYNEDD